MKITALIFLLASVCNVAHLSVPEATYDKQMKDCLKDINASQRRMDASDVTRKDTAMMDGYDAILLRSVTCSNWAAEPLSDDAKAVIDKSNTLHRDMVQHMRYRKN